MYYYLVLMNYMQLIKTSVFALLLFVGVQATPVSAQSIVDIALSDDNFSSLVDAVVAQDLVDTLNSEGPFTVFAPTNDAFAALPGYVAKALEENPALLTDVLLYHVVAGELFAADVLEEKHLTTVEGGRVVVSANDDGAFINQSQLIATDVDATNGVVHIIDKVLIPDTVYRAAFDSIRAEITLLRDALREIVNDRTADRSHN